METMQWKDVTSYSQNEPFDQRVPRTWEAKVGDIDIIVTRIFHYPDIWFCRSRALDMEARELKSKDVNDAQAEALKLVKEELYERIKQAQFAIHHIDIKLREVGAYE